jgi:hypothetical protein
MRILCAYYFQRNPLLGELMTAQPILKAPAVPSRFTRPVPAWVLADPANAPSTSNQGWDEVPFQRWYRFKEAFAPRLVWEAIQMVGRPISTCYDAFGGGGTTPLVCQYLGITPTVSEVNPFLADLIEAKLTSYDPHALIDARASLAGCIRRAETAWTAAAAETLFPGAPATFVQPGVGDRWVFDLEVARRIKLYVTTIDALPDASVRRLFRVLLGSTLLGLSNVVVNGKGRRYRKPSRRHRVSVYDVDPAFSAAFERALFDVCRYESRAEQSYTMLRGDARQLAGIPEGIDLALFSPPYPNSFDYTDIYNVELWALGYLSSSDDNRQLRESTLRSHVQIKRDFSASEVVGHSPALQATLRELEAVKGSLWNPHIPAMVAAYFDDLATVLRGLRQGLAEKGRVMMVVGDSRYAGVVVDVPKIVAEIASTCGLIPLDSRIVRVMRASAQQGGDLSLGESLLVLGPVG